MLCKMKLVTILLLVTALSGTVYADIDSLSEEELFLKLQAELPVIDHSNCVVIPEQKDSNYIYIYNLRSHIINLHPEWSTGVKESILNGDVKDGMTKKQVQASWGLPKDTKVNLDKSGTHELWHYGISVYLYFENGELSGRH